MNLPRSTPSAEAVDARGVLALLDALDRPDVEMHSLVLLRHGRVLAEGYWSPYAADRVHLLYSLSKSFTATAAALAAGEGALGLDDTVLSHFPELDAEITDPRSRAMTVRHIAAMASGHHAETLPRALAEDPANPVRGFLLIPPDADPGTVFAYNQPCTFTLGAIVQRTSGQRLSEYLRPRLLEPLGIGEVGWLSHGDLELGFSGLHARTGDVAALGQLYLQQGRWDGEQLLPPEWVAEAVRCQVDNPDGPNPDWRQGYGLQFWLSQHGYRGDGAFGQFCLVLPEHDVVLATTAATENMQAVLDAVWEHLLPALDAAGDAGADRELAERLTTLTLPTTPVAGPVTDASPWARRHPVAAGEQTPSGLGEVELVAGPEPSLRLHQEGATLTVPLPAVTGWRVLDVPGAEGPVPVAVAAGQVDAHTLHLDLVLLETPHRLDVRLRAGRPADVGWRTAPLHPGPLHRMRCPRWSDPGLTP